MKANCIFNDQLESTPLGQAYTQTLRRLLAEDSSVFAFECDLAGAVSSGPLADEFPGRVLNMGIQEANAIGMAAGMASIGKKPFFHTFGAFASRRVFDQLFMSVAYGGNTVRIYGSDPGICAKYNGGTHSALEDVALMRSLPNATVFDVCDSTMFKDLLCQSLNMEGLIYFRADRSPAKAIYQEGSTFDAGKGVVLRDGSDATIIASGIMVSEALRAANELEAGGISTAVIDMFTIKPIDKELIVKYAKKTRAVVTAENHNVNGGLGDAVAAVLTEKYPVHQGRIAVKDKFGEVGSFDYLKQRFSLTSADIAGEVKDIIKKEEK